MCMRTSEEGCVLREQQEARRRERDAAREAARKEKEEQRAKAAEDRKNRMKIRWKPIETITDKFGKVVGKLLDSGYDGMVE